MPHGCSWLSYEEEDLLPWGRFHLCPNIASQKWLVAFELRRVMSGRGDEEVIKKKDAIIESRTGNTPKSRRYITPFIPVTFERLIKEIHLTFFLATKVSILKNIFSQDRGMHKRWQTIHGRFFPFSRKLFRPGLASSVDFRSSALALPSCSYVSSLAIEFRRVSFLLRAECSSLSLFRHVCVLSFRAWMRRSHSSERA